ncbi:NYN domain-containing protein [Ammoniphilus sp. CFH 90114]|uniref:NYN domain-containing protein n=1 Tax=Ammoniphilus sp. CFH 90114 TaxID=2493665 RepID=UPI00100E6041|nr:NYN domain-containing protein [Ammoniphilus sp. CFH 90114]RXT09057.1 NYN domain-containing protein [Ammoniphilus sp. CFH 90114]
MEELLVVDGYNMIGAWPKLAAMKKNELGRARDELLTMLSEFQAYSGYKIVVVFDAHQVPGMGKRIKEYKVDIFYTKENETADELIERLVKKEISRKRRITVATSDYTEQRMSFGYGALRKSARELLEDIEKSKKSIRQKVDKIKYEPLRSGIPLKGDIAELFEKWRRQ